MTKAIGIVTKLWLVVGFILCTEAVDVECVTSIVRNNILELNKLGLLTGTAQIMNAVRGFSKHKKNAAS